MACKMEADFLRYATFLYHLAHPFTDRPIIEVRKYKVVFLERLVAFDYLQGNVQQLYLERHTRLVSLGDNPFLSVYLHNLVVAQFLDVHERQGSKAGKNKNITEVGVLGVFELKFHQCFQLIFCQVFTFLCVRAYVELGKRISRMCPLKCARITTPFSHMQFSHIEPLCNPASLERKIANSLMKSGVSSCMDISFRL